jgi:GNAT superfamily N-acetyltransferase
MIQFMRKLFQNVVNLGNTVRGEYGGGIKGYANFFYYSLFRFNTFGIYRLDLATFAEPTRERAAETVLFQELDGPSLELLTAGRSDLPREFYCHKMHRVSACCAGTVEGRLAYIHWIYRQGDFSRFLRLTSRTAEINHVFTLPEYRGRGLSTRGFLATAQDMKKKGVTSLVAVIHDENVASIKAFERAGFVKTGEIRAFGQFNGKREV